jgi:LacI family transcriptional regulator
VIRLKDIAERVDVSVMTVSRVMRDTPNIAPATRRRVLRVARELGYVPDAAARGLRLQNTHLLGLVLPALGDPAWADIASALEAAWAPIGYDLAMACSHQDEEAEEARIARLMGRRVEGLFVAPLTGRQKVGGIYRQLREQRIRVVIMGPKPEHLGTFPSVTVNDQAGMQLGVAHLRNLGHERIAFLRGPEDAPSAKARLDGYRKALGIHGLTGLEELIVPAGTTVEDGAQATRRLLERKAAFTAIMTFSDPLAVGAMRALTTAGLEVPRQISVIGYANHPCSEFAGRPLTTVDTDVEGQARAAVAVMSDLIAGKEGRDRQVEPRLVQRDSCAAAAPLVTPR